MVGGVLLPPPPLGGVGVLLPPPGGCSVALPVGEDVDVTAVTVGDTSGVIVTVTGIGVELGSNVRKGGKLTAAPGLNNFPPKPLE